MEVFYFLWRILSVDFLLKIPLILLVYVEQNNKSITRDIRFWNDFYFYLRIYLVVKMKDIFSTISNQYFIFINFQIF